MAVRPSTEAGFLTVLWVLVACLSLQADVKISELMYHPQNEVLEFVELYNTSDGVVDLGGWSLSDGVLYTFSDGTLLPRGERLVVCQDVQAVANAYGIQSAFLVGNYSGALSNGGERVALTNDQGDIVDEVEYSDSPPFSLLADGQGPSLERLCFTVSADVAGNWRESDSDGGTPLLPNSSSICPPPLPVPLSPVVISEIHYHPPGDTDPEGEFIELHNWSDSPFDLDGWQLADAVRYTFDIALGPTVVPAGGYLLVAKDPALLAAASGVSPEEIAGPYEGRLSNFRDNVELRLVDGPVLDRVRYSQDGLWPARADGLGTSLQLINPSFSSALPQNWRVAGGDCAPAVECVLLDNGVALRWFENVDGGDPGFSGAVPWYHPNFDDVTNGWRDGEMAVGYDTRVPDGQPWVRTRSTSVNGLHSILLRIEFSFDPENNACGTDIPFFFVDWDDGYIAWLNGVEIARGGMLDPPGTVPAFDGQYRAEIITAGGFRQSEPVYQQAWTGTAGSLLPGRNVLAVGSYNSRSTSSDLYFTGRMTLGPSVTSGSFTPGATNSVAAAVVPPLVHPAEHLPAEPTSGDTVAITTRVDGPEVQRVDLVYDAGSGEQTVPMAGDGIYTAEIPPQPHMTLVRYRIEASSLGAEGCPASYPREGNPSRYTGYLVADDRPQVTEDVRLFYIFTPGALTDLSCAERVRTPGSFVDFRGRAHFNVGVKFRGQTACNYPKKPLRVRFNKGDTFDGQRNLNFNAGWNDKAMLREQLGFDFFRDAGVPYCETHMARVHTNNGIFHGAYFTIEDPASSFLRRNGWDSDGPFYKCTTPMLSGGTSGYEPRNDEAEARLAEVGAFAATLNSSSGQALIDFLNREMNIEEMIDYQAVQVILIDGDSVVKNWLLYIGPHGRGQVGEDRFAVFAWDIDLSHGQMYLVQDVRHHNIHPLFQTQTYPFVGQGHHGMINALLQRAPNDYYVKAYYGRMWTLLEEKFNPALSFSRIHQYEANTQDTVVADAQRWPRTWGAQGNNPLFWRDDLRNWMRRRYDYLTSYLTSDNPTTGGRRFQYTPAPRLKITEIHYNPGGNEEFAEFLEIRNLEDSTVDLSGWTLPAIEYEFPPGSEAPAEGYIVVARNLAIFDSLYSLPPGVPLFGPYTGNLSNGGEELRLRDNGMYRGRQYYPETIDVLTYGDETPWPPQADGDGKSLELVDLDLDNDFAKNWQASLLVGGTPGRGVLSNLPPVIHLVVTPTSGVVPLRVEFDASGSFDPEGDEFTVRWDFGDGIFGAGETVARTYLTPGVFRVTVTLDDGIAPHAVRVVEVTALEEAQNEFVRGDINEDGVIDISDPVRLVLGHFEELGFDCARSADADDNGILELTDALVLLNFIFLFGDPPEDPFPQCGPDTTSDNDTLDCSTYEPCS